MKCFPVCYHCQAPIGLALDLREQVEISSIAEIEVETYGVSFRQVAADASRWAPATRETADHSMPYCVAVALLDSEVTPQSFSDQRLVDPAIAGLMRKIKVRENPEYSAQYPASVPCRFTTRLNTGQVVETESQYPKGHASVPLDDRTLETKIRGMFSAYGSQAQCEMALNGLWRFEQAEDVAEVLKLFVVASSGIGGTGGTPLI